MSGDALARGDKSAQFSTGGGAVSQVKWDYATLTEEEFLKKYPDGGGLYDRQSSQAG